MMGRVLGHQLCELFVLLCVLLICSYIGSCDCRILSHVRDASVCILTFIGWMLCSICSCSVFSVYG